MNGKVSIIVPVYNAAHYLEKCVESLLVQTYQNLEIMLIDDGSKDESLSICEAYCERDSRVKVFHHENHGVSYTRNFGLDHVSGEYVTFVDSDDWVEPNYVEVLLRYIQKNRVSVSMCGYSMDYNDGRIVRATDFAETKLAMEESLNPISQYFLGGVLSKMYTVSVLNDLENGNIRFAEDIKIAEDCLFWYNVILRVGEIFISSEPLYHYIMNESSAIHTLNLDSAYTCFVAKRRMVELLTLHEKLKSQNEINCTYEAIKTLYYFKKKFQKDERIKEMKLYVKKNRRALFLSNYLPLRLKIHAFSMMTGTLKIYRKLCGRDRK